MRTQATKPASDWDSTEWASIERTDQAQEVSKWTFWQWAGVTPRNDQAAYGRGESALSGWGHNPSGNHWAQGYGSRS